ncbi:hypothetical protein HZB07_05050 [Candidatus Saganbacteria bacterium]|nr:hypothetical protein [Candidatus Saganbacteria bacterium]
MDYVDLIMRTYILPDITILEIVESLEGEIRLLTKKVRQAPVIQDFFSALEKILKEQLRSTTLEDLLLKASRWEAALTYNI